ncbi:MAG: chromate transporter [Candidatus Lustribacter sp.]|jgi:chromate transporter
MTSPPTTREIFFTFLRMTLTAFGGAIGWAHRTVVVDRAWLSEREFAETLSLCQFVPGPNITNFAVAVAARFRGAPGAIAAMVALVVPPMCILIVVGALYERIAGVAAIHGALNGLSAAAAGLLLVMLYSVLRTLVQSRPAVTVPIALASFAAVVSGVLSVPLALIVLGPVSVALAWFRRN